MVQSYKIRMDKRVGELSTEPRGEVTFHLLTLCLNIFGAKCGKTILRKDVASLLSPTPSILYFLVIHDSDFSTITILTTQSRRNQTGNPEVRDKGFRAT